MTGVSSWMEAITGCHLLCLHEGKYEPTNVQKTGQVSGYWGPNFCPSSVEACSQGGIDNSHLANTSGLLMLLLIQPWLALLPKESKALPLAHSTCRPWYPDLSQHLLQLLPFTLIALIILRDMTSDWASFWNVLPPWPTLTSLSSLCKGHLFHKTFTSHTP